VIDRRKNPREFFVSGWDPYVIELTAESRDPAGRVADGAKTDAADAPPSEPVITRRRAMLMQRGGST